MEKPCALEKYEKGMIKYQIESIKIVHFSSVIDEVSNNTCYDFKKMGVQKFINDSILKSTDTQLFQKMILQTFQ